MWRFRHPPAPVLQLRFSKQIPQQLKERFYWKRFAASGEGSKRGRDWRECDCRRRVRLNNGDVPTVVNSLMNSSPGETETFQTLLNLPGLRLQQIVSNGQASAEGIGMIRRIPSG